MNKTAGAYCVPVLCQELWDLGTRCPQLHSLVSQAEHCRGCSCFPALSSKLCSFRWDPFCVHFLISEVVLLTRFTKSVDERIKWNTDFERALKNSITKRQVVILWLISGFDHFIASVKRVEVENISVCLRWFFHMCNCPTSCPRGRDFVMRPLGGW